MKGSSDFKDSEDKGLETNSTRKLPMADLISLETVVNLLVRKGVCTLEELFEEEKIRQQYNHLVKDVSIVRTGCQQSMREERSNRRKQSWLKRKMSKRRWTRRLGTALFGWQWKKIKRNNREKNLADI